MDNFKSRIYIINDFREWRNRGQLEISPKFQRRSVWNQNAKSYLIDTILRNQPMPKIFIREITDPKTKITTREIVDGQQRIRTILAFIDDGFKVSKIHNVDFGGKLFSDLPENTQTEFLDYGISVDTLSGMTDREVLDVFARLNTYSVKLNKQELLNANYFGYFKQTVYNLGWDYYEFWLQNKILTDNMVARMGEAEIVGDLIIAMLNGIQSKRSADKYYKEYDQKFARKEELTQKFHDIMDLIANLYGDQLSDSAFNTVPNFYGLFVSLYHMQYEIPALSSKRKAITKEDFPKITNAIEQLNDILLSPEGEKNHFDFVKSTKDATTDIPARTTRCEYICKQFMAALE